MPITIDVPFQSQKVNFSVESNLLKDVCHKLPLNLITLQREDMVLKMQFSVSTCWLSPNKKHLGCIKKGRRNQMASLKSCEFSFGTRKFIIFYSLK